MPSAADLAALVLRRCYERLVAGQASVSLQDAAALIRLAREIERDDAVATAAERDHRNVIPVSPLHARHLIHINYRQHVVDRTSSFWLLLWVVDT